MLTNYIDKETTLLGIVSSFGFLNLFLWVGILTSFCRRRRYYFINPRNNYLTPNLILPNDFDNKTDSKQSVETKKDEENNKEYVVNIIRGVPGSGKKLLAYSMEYKKYRPFSICYANDYFKKPGGVYEYNRYEQDRANSYCYNKFVNSINDSIANIYVLGYFEEPWMYQNYMDLAESSGYKVNIIEMFCPNEDYLAYFNKRSQHNIPMKASLRMYDNWVFDKSAKIQEPFLEELEGDCMPAYPRPSIAQLDKELLEYMNGSGKAPTVYKSHYTWEFENTDHIVTELKQKIINKISRWEIVHLLINYIDFKRTNNSSNYEKDYVDTMKQFANSSINENLFYNITKNDSYFHRTE